MDSIRSLISLLSYTSCLYNKSTTFQDILIYWNDFRSLCFMSLWLYSHFDAEHCPDIAVVSFIISWEKLLNSRLDSEKGSCQFPAPPLPWLAAAPPSCLECVRVKVHTRKRRAYLDLKPYMLKNAFPLLLDRVFYLIWAWKSVKMCWTSGNISVF